MIARITRAQRWRFAALSIAMSVDAATAISTISSIMGDLTLEVTGCGARRAVKNKPRCSRSPVDRRVSPRFHFEATLFSLTSNFVKAILDLITLTDGVKLATMFRTPSIGSSQWGPSMTSRRIRSLEKE